MWFAKWFGGRKDEQEDDEPARFPPTPVAPPPAADTLPQQPASKAKPADELARAKNGFDPYNSGAFQRQNAWERTNRRR